MGWWPLQLLAPNLFGRLNACFEEAKLASHEKSWSKGGTLGWNSPAGLVLVRRIAAWLCPNCEHLRKRC